MDTVSPRTLDTGKPWSLSSMDMLSDVIYGQAERCDLWKRWAMCSMETLRDVIYGHIGHPKMGALIFLMYWYIDHPTVWVHHPLLCMTRLFSCLTMSMSRWTIKQPNLYSCCYRSVGRCGGRWQTANYSRSALLPPFRWKQWILECSTGKGLRQVRASSYCSMLILPNLTSLQDWRPTQYLYIRLMGGGW